MQRGRTANTHRCIAITRRSAPKRGSTYITGPFVCLYQLVRVLASSRSDVGCSSCPCLQTYLRIRRCRPIYIARSLRPREPREVRTALYQWKDTTSTERHSWTLLFLVCMHHPSWHKHSRSGTPRNNFLRFCLLKTASYYARFNTLQQLASLATHYSTQHLRRRPDAVGLGLKNHRLSLTRRQPILM
jgi:hypothetical protein